MPAWGNIRVRGNRAAFAALAALVCALIALAALPALASARNIVVDGTGPLQVGAGCVSHLAGEECTLSGAIETANEEAGPDTISFDESVFVGDAEHDEIDLTAALETVTESVTIEGPGDCTSSGIAAPCVGVSAAAGDDAFIVEANDVQISGLAITGDEAGIEVVGGSTGFIAKGDWIGLRLDGSASGTVTDGIYLGPGADGAQIGGMIGDAASETAARNVFAHSEVGILVEGASQTKILGNYIGVDPAGGAAAMETGVRIVDGLGSPAEENEVGGARGSGGATGLTCDGACNAIATEGGEAIDLSGSGEPAASGPTVIRGNFLGLAPDGGAKVGENSYGVFAVPGEIGCDAGPADVTVGGTAPADANYIAADVGIYAEGTENFSAIGNAIGIAPDGRVIGAPDGTGIGLCLSGVSEEAHVDGNRMAIGVDAVGIESEWGHASISGNTIEGSLFGISTGFGSEGTGDTVTGNTITGSDRNGILVGNEFNVVTGNTVSASGWSGILIEEGAEHNRVGGDLPGEANVIDDSERGAIEIDGPESSRNEIAANTGAGNEEAFIQLFGHQSTEAPNGNIKPPTLAIARQSSASGTAQPEATVRIFSKASTAEGELGALLAVVKADSSGAWSTTYATHQVGTLVAATQTSDAGTAEAGTSEVSAPMAAVADPVEPVEPGGGGSGGGSNSGGSSTSTPQQPVQPAPAKPKAPRVAITKGPKKSSKSTTAKFAFKATPAAGAKFQCKLDNAKWASCKSPKTYKHLKPRKHTFQVRAMASGLTGPAAKFNFTIKP